MDIGKLYETLTGEPCPHAPHLSAPAALLMHDDEDLDLDIAFRPLEGVAFRSDARD